MVSTPITENGVAQKAGAKPRNEHLNQNAEHAATVVSKAVAAMPSGRSCKCGSALASALITDKTKVPEATLKKLELLVGKYFT